MLYGVGVSLTQDLDARREVALGLIEAGIAPLHELARLLGPDLGGFACLPPRIGPRVGVPL
jgi:hypothetical protein